MNEQLTRKANLFGAWCGVAYCVLLFVGWWVLGGFFPLHDPSAGPEEIAAFFRNDVTGIRIGMILLMWGAAAFIPFAASISDQLAQVEGRTGPLSRIALLGGYANAMLTFYPPMYWLTNAFRPTERPIELLYLVNDIAWLQFIGGLSLVMPLYIVVGIAGLNRRAADVFPRWCGYASFLVFTLMLPDQLLFFFKSGPFAWNGLFAFWVPLTVFTGWFLMMFYVIRRNALRTESRAGQQLAVAHP